MSAATPPASAPHLPSDAVPRRYRAVHGGVAAVALVAVVLQLVLVWQGHGVLDESDPPSRGERVERFFCYFTILSNLLVLATSLDLAAGGGAQRRWARVLRLDALVAITVTGVIHWFLLRPLLDLSGVDYLADKLLHVVVPLLALLAWLLATPAGWLRRTDLLASAGFPAVYIVWTLVHGAWRDWYPYPFIDVRELGYGHVLLNGLGVVVLMVALSLAAIALDRRVPLAGAPAGGRGATSASEEPRDPRPDAGR